MALIEALTVNVAAKLAKVIVKLWLKDEGLVGGAEGVIETVKKYFEDWRVARSAEGLVRNLEDDVASRLDRFINVEFPNMADNEREAAALAVADALGKLELGPAIMRTDLDAALLDRAVREADPNAFRLLGVDTRSLAERLRRECCNYIVTLAPKLPRFDAEATKELLIRNTSILRELQSVMDEVVAIRRQASDSRDQAVAEFEHEYMFALARVLDRVELFGVRITGTATREYGLTRTYVPLGAVQEGGGEPCRVDDTLAQSSRIVIRGEAGFGKTILMQWLAVQAARRNFAGALEPWNQRVPFYVKLREFREASRPLPTPSQFLSGALSNLLEAMPKGWADNAMAEFGLILVDGVDEVPGQRRKQLFEWLRALQDQYPKAIFVVSSRPAALDADDVPLGSRLTGLGYSTVTLEPMTPDDSEALVIKWHAEVASGLADPAVLAQLAENERSLRRAMRERPAIRSLGSNPLLCTMMCALNWDQKANLPDDRMELYRIALELLLERREKDREIGPAFVAGLDRVSKESLLDNIAYWMLRNGISQADRNEAEMRIFEALPRLAHLPKEPHLIMQELIERSGVLRQPQYGVVDFVHRTFLEYMGARAALAQGDRDALVSRASEENWRDVIVFAAGHAQGKARDELVGKLLRPGRVKANRAIEADVTCVCCLETVNRNLDPDLLAQLRKKAMSLFPPKDFAFARMLVPAAANNPEFLEGYADQPTEIVAACIRTASIVGTPRMLAVIASYALVPGELIDQELTRAYQMFDNNEFEEKVLAHRDRLFGLQLSMLDSEHAQCLKLLLLYKTPKDMPGELRDALTEFGSEGGLNLTRFSRTGSDDDAGETRPGDGLGSGNKRQSRMGKRTRAREIDRMAELHSLKSLRLWSVDGDAIPEISKLPLRQLAFAIDEPADLAPLASMLELETLDLAGGGIVTLKGLRDLPNLRRLTISTAKFYDALDCIGPGCQLRHLSLYSVPISDLSRISLAPMLESLELTNLPIDTYSHLATLTNLRSLTLGYTNTDEGFPWRSMSALESLRLSGPGPALLAGVVEAPALETINVRYPPTETIAWVPASVRTLEIWRNNLKLDLTGIGRIRELRKFDASECKLFGSKELLQLPKLEEVDFYASAGDFKLVVESLKANGVEVSVWGSFRS